MKQLWLALWGMAIGAVVLFVFFSFVADVPPADIAPVTGAIAVICVLWLIRSARIELELRSRAGDPQLRADHNRARERRGF